MGLPTLENGPYVFNVNNRFTESNTTNKTLRGILECKNALVALGGAGSIWSVVASCDSTTVKNIGDASPDLWSELADIVGGSGAHSWCILENGTTGAQLCIDLSNSDERYVHWRYSYGGNFNADGTTSTRPTDSEGTDLKSVSYTTFSSGTGANTIVIHAMCSADHKTTRIFTHEKDSSGNNGGTALCIEEAVNTPSEWTATYKTVLVKFHDHITLSQTSYLKSPLIKEISDAERMVVYMKTAEPYEAWNSVYATCECYGTLDGGVATPIHELNVSLELQGGYPISPIGLYEAASGSNGGSWGRLRDIYFGQRLHDTLSTYPNDASRLWVKFGCFVVPWNGEQPLDAVAG